MMRTSQVSALSLVYCLAALCASFCSCTQQRSGSPALSPARTLHFTTHLFSQREGDCAASAGCALVTLQFPEIQGGTVPAAADSVREAVRNYMLSPLVPGTRVDSLGDLSSQFIDSFREAQRQYPGKRHWDLQRRVSIVRDSAGIIALDMREFSFTGGAHPKTSLEYANFDARSGRRLRLADIVLNGMQGELLVLAEKEFRAQTKIPEGTSLAAAGYRFTGDRFALNENFLLSDDTLLFHYNVYEIAPYAMGSTTVRIPLATVRHIVRDTD